jgi:hypothetical protein
MEPTKTKKIFFSYPIKAKFSFANVSNVDIINLSGEFVLLNKGKKIETITKTISNKKAPLYCSTLEPSNVSINFKQKALTKKELENYSIQIYLYKDEKYKTFVAETKLINGNPR